MARSETQQIAQLDANLKSMDETLNMLIKDLDRFKWHYSNINFLPANQIKSEFEDIKKRSEELGKAQERTAEFVKKKIEEVSRSRRNDTKIIERQNKLLEAQQNLSKTGGFGSKFASLMGGIDKYDFASIAQLANSKPSDGIKGAAKATEIAQEKGIVKIKKTTDEIKKQQEEVSRLSDGVGRLGKAIAAAFGINQIKNFISGMLKIRGEFEMAEVALVNLIGNQEKSQLIWKKTMNLAVNSPLTAQQLTQYTKQLAAFHIETSRLYDTTKMLADVSVGLGVDMQRLILAYGHTKASGFLRGMYARQFATAGVNIYGELADYYTLIEGRLVTIKEVYDRVSKRLVSFADVEHVFERITGEGGRFYNMQQVLSDTVQGQINKIKDSWQQAMNDIGKSQTGVIRGVTNAVLQIVKNWRIWLSAIEGTTVAIIAFKATNIVRTLTSASYAANAASRSTLRLATSIKALGASFKANLPALAISAVVAAVTALAMAEKHMKDFNKEIDNQNVKLYDARQKLLDYQKRVEENNKAIQEYKASNDRSEEAQRKLTKAQKDNQSVISELKKEYPELEEGTKTLIDGEVLLTAKLEAHNQSLRDQISLNDQIKQQNIVEDPFSKDAQQFNDELQKNIKDIQKYQSRAKVLLLKGGVDAVQDPLLNQLIGIDLKNPEKAIKEYNNIVKSIADGATQAYNDAWDEIERDNRKVTDPASYRDYKQQLTPSFYKRRLYGTLLGSLNPIDEASNAKREFDRELNIIRADGMSLLEQMRLMFLDAVDSVPEYKDEIDKKYTAAVEEYRKQLKEGQEVTDEAAAEIKRNVISQYVIENIDKIINDIHKGANDVNETVRTFFVSQGYALNDEMESVLNERLSKYILYHEKQMQLQALSQQLAKETHKKEKNRVQETIDAINAEIAEMEKEMPAVHDFFAEIIQKASGGEDGDGNGRQYKNFSALLDIIKKMNGEYEKLSKSAYGFAKSANMVRNSYREAFDSILGKGASDLVNWDTLDFTSKQGVRNALQELYDNLSSKKLWGKYGKEVKDLQDKLKREIANTDVEIGINAQVRIREDFGRQMEEAFGNYELTLDLQKLNLPSNVLSDLFDLETVDLSDLRRRVTTFYNELKQEGDIDRDDMKSIEGYIKKIDDMERKQQRERIKDYAKYLEYELSERAKISMEYARKIAQVQIEKFSDDEEENSRRRQKIIDGLNKEKDEKLAKQDWEDFKSMDVYVQMMEDLEKHGTVALRTMREELEKIRKNAKNLSPRALKEVVSAIEKIREIELNRSDPFRGVSEAREDVKNALKAAGVSSKAELYAEADAAEKKLVSVQQEKREVDEIVAAKKKEKELTEDITKLAKKDVIKDVLSNNMIEDKMVALTDLMNKKQQEANDIAEERERLEKEILKLSREQSRLIDEESKESTSAERKKEIKTRLGKIDNRLGEINGLIDTKEVDESIAKGIVNEIYRYIQAKGELSGLSSELLSDRRGENEQKELSDREKKLQEIQEKYQAAINAIDTYNKQVARLMVFIDTWTGKVQELWSSISELSSAYEGEFGDWVSRWGGVVDTTFQQVSKLSKAFADFKAVRADYLKSATKKVADKASSAVDNMEKASETAQTQANTAATQANTLAKTENATASNLAAMGNSAVGTSAAAATPAVITFGAALLMAMGWVGLIMAALEALFAIIKAIAGAHDSQLDKQIENQQKKIDALRDAYARLEKQIEKTWDSVSYMQTYEQQVANIREQIAAMEAQKRAEESKKNTDDNAVRQYTNDIHDAYDQLEELEKKSIEVFGGIGEEGYRSAAEGFVDAWKSAFLETGDGLQGLQDHFDEFLQDWFVKQATMRIAGRALEPLLNQIDAAVDKYGAGGTNVLMSELANVREQFAVIAPELSAALEELAGMWNLQGEGGLSGLAAGIQGMTEEQANILEAYWNSVRMYTASIDGNVARIADILGTGGVNTNPQLQQLTLIAQNTNSINTLLQSVTRSGHALGGYGIKVFSD